MSSLPPINRLPLDVAGAERMVAGWLAVVAKAQATGARTDEKMSAAIAEMRLFWLDLKGAEYDALVAGRPLRIGAELGTTISEETP